MTGQLNKPAISYKTTRRIDAIKVRKLFHGVQFNHWFGPADVMWYLKHALFVASAWTGRQCAGIVVLTGDGRINVNLDLLVVDKAFQGKGIGSTLMELAVRRVQWLKPYHASIEVFERRTERFYARFGFVRNKGTWLLEHAPTAQRLRRKATACRQWITKDAT